MAGSGADLEYARMLQRAGIVDSSGMDGARLEQILDESGSDEGIIVDAQYNGLKHYYGGTLPALTPELYANCIFTVLPPYPPEVV